MYRASIGMMWRAPPQIYEFGGAVNRDPVALRARNRLVVLQANGGSIGIFPPPHKFFFAREIELNLGYVWYRNRRREDLFRRRSPG